jgi:redox-sensitive bicupin YhaK (pirin superfamily)
MPDSIDRILKPHIQDLGGFQARRLLPHEHRMMVGPFIFFDHLGPAQFDPGQGVDVRPHPHINLATVTYLFEGVLRHRDSLGAVQDIYPGAVNWMTAGRGITHSERTPEFVRQSEAVLHGIQTWVALPDDHEEVDPWFKHHPEGTLPRWQTDGATITLIAGSAYGYSSPVQTLSPMVYLDMQCTPDCRVVVPADYSERAIYSVTGGIVLDGEPLPQHRMALLAPGSTPELGAATAGRCMIIGGEPVGPRIKWWNFVSSRQARIDQAKQDWKAGRFSAVPEETEFIPLPEGRP